MSKTIGQGRRRGRRVNERRKIAIAIPCLALLLTLAVSALAFAPKTTEAAEGELYIESFTSPTGWGITGFNTSSGNYAFCIDPPAYPPIATTMTTWSWTGEAQGIIPDPHALAYLMWAVTNNARGFETPVESTVIATWLLCPPAEVDLDSGDYTNGRQSANIYEGFGTRVSRNDRDKIISVVEEARAHSGQAGPWDRASRIWYSPDSSLQNIVEMLPNGTVTLGKHSAAASVTDGNTCYSLEGARYSVWRDAACTEYAGFDFRTDANGHAELRDVVPAGTYYVREEEPPRGYLPDETVYAVEVEAGSESHLDTYERPLYDSAQMWVQKVDETTGNPVPEGSGSLAGAEFTLRYFENEGGSALGNPAREWVLRTDETGAALLDDRHKASGPDFYRNEEGAPCMPIGTVTVQETKPPAGYLLEGQRDSSTQGFQAPIHTHVITGDGSGLSVGQRNVDTVPEPPVRGGVSLVKEDVESGDAPQGNAGFANIGFDIINKNPNLVVVGGRAYQPGETISGLLKTNARGEAATAPDALPYGTYAIEEAETNESMRRTSGPQDVTISEDRAVVRVGEAFRDEVVRGGVKVGKIDREGALHEPQGSASLAGAVVAIINRSDSKIRANGNFYAPGEVVCELTTSTDGTASTEAETLPYGSYELREKVPPRGYLPNPEWKREFEIREDKTIVDESTVNNSANDQVIRGDLEGNKAGAGSMARLARVPLVIESQTTGEAHVIVTDENGEFDTSSGNRSHAQGTNANDAVVTKGADGQWRVADESGLDASAGVWFSGYSDYSKNPTPKDELGALPFDTYKVSEVRCKANEGYELISFPITVSRNRKIVNIGTIDDEPSPEIGTFAHAEGSESQEIEADGTIRLTDSVYYERLTPNTDYRITGTLHVRNDDGSDGGALTDAEGNEVTTCTEFRARAANGTKDVTFELDSSRLDGRDLVAFERVTRLGDDSDVTSHEDISDQDQTVRVRPRIATTATDPIDGDHEAPGVGIVTVRDTIRYAALRPGREYAVNGTLVDRETGRPVTDADGNAVTSSRTFSPEAPSGTVDIEFTADGSLLAGRTVVAFESVSRDGVEVAAHADIDDDGQAVSFPKIGTTATVNGRKEAETGEGITVTDEVRYENLTPGAEYTISGRLVDKSDGATLRGSDGREATATVTLVAEEASGTVLLDLVPDARDLGDADLVVFEELRKGEQKVAEHADVSDQDQTVHVRPRIATTATDPIDGDHEAPSTGAVRIRDDVGYQGLRPGREYAVNGTLVDRETGRPVTDADGNAVTSSRTFSPEAPSGTVDIEFTADGSLLAGRTVVAFESVSRDGVEVAAHADIDDDGQAVSFPKIGTVAKVDSVDSGEQGAEKLTVIDSVHYENLVPNTEYTLKGHLVDKESGGPVGRENGEVAAETTFRTSQSNGTVDVRFEYDRSLTIDSTTVVFESLYKSGQRVAEHADVENEDQSFNTPTIYTTASDMADGDKQVNGLGSVSIQDSVLHRGLERGETYTLHGRLMDRGTGTPIRDAGGNEITAERTFAAESPDGIVPVEFVCDGRLLSGKTAVVFEDLSRDDKVVARHADMNDEGQSVEGARIQTVARDRADGDKNVSPDGDQAIVDTVSYTGLTPGKTYTLTATLRNKPSSSSSRENSGASDDIDDQSDVLSSGTTTFCPSSSNGTVEVKIACRPKRFAGQDLVVFEKLTTQSDATGEGEGPAVAEHADPDDEDQTVHIDSPSKDMPQTGVDARSFAVGIAGLATVCATVTHLIKRRLCRRRHR